MARANFTRPLQPHNPALPVGQAWSIALEAPRSVCRASYRPPNLLAGLLSAAGGVAPGSEEEESACCHAREVSPSRAKQTAIVMIEQNG